MLVQRLALLFLCLAPAAFSQDAYTVVPQKQTTIYESNWLRVRHVVYQPGESVPMHEHKARIVVFLGDADVQSIAPDGKIQENHFKAGLVNWSEPIRHALTNSGKTPLDAVEVELLGQHPATPQAFTGDPVKQDPDHFQLVFENDRVRVFRYHLGPQESSPMHDHLDHVAVRLTNAHWHSIQPDGSSRVVNEKAGEVSYRPSNRHAIRNLENAPVEAISIEFKSPK